MKADLHVVLLWLLVGLVALFIANVILGLVQTAYHHRLMNPSPPVNVRLVTRHGVEIPVQCVYVGRFDGVHRWEVIRPDGIAEPSEVAAVNIEALPAKTAIAMFRHDEGGPR